MFRFIQRKETDPYYNIAAEEYLLKNAATDTFMIWRNKPSVIIGKHQNTSREINHDFIESRNLPVIRRITGGGTVYHDPGNINFSFIYTNRKENLIDFREFTLPIILFLHELGLKASFEGKSNITISGLKVSGNSAHIYKQKVLHHGTLLFNTDLDLLEKSLGSHEEHYKDKSIRSVRAEVANICDLLKEKISVDLFTDLFQAFISNYFSECYNEELKVSEQESIKILAEEKYRTYRWNYGYSPDYKYDEEWTTTKGKFSVSLVVKDGLIRKTTITGPETITLFLKTISDHLTGTQHEKKSIAERMRKFIFADENEGQVLNQIIQHLL